MAASFYSSAAARIAAESAAKAKGFTYAVSNGGHIKIGRAGDVEERLATLQCASPYRLELVCVADGDIEKKTHDHLERENLQRLVGEWFEDTRRLRDELWRLGFKAVGGQEQDHREAEIQFSYMDGRAVGFTQGVDHAARSLSVEFNDLHAEEHF